MLTLMEKKDFKKRFPKLAQEMENGISKADVEFEAAKLKSGRKFAGYNPDAIDFIRRCTNEDQAYEIIEYLENRGEVSKEEAEKLCNQLKEDGLASFGRKKDPGFYEREG
jgi:hypothetical protein